MSCGDWDRLAVFDLDGCLADTKALVFQAYRRAGVDMPEHAWGQPWQNWLPAHLDHDEVRVADIRKRKREIYISLLRHPSRRNDLALPPTEVATKLQAEGHQVRVLTGASPTVARLLIEQLDLDSGTLAGSMLGLPGKMTWLALQARRGRKVVYVDDDVGAFYHAPDDVGVVTYEGQSADQLRGEMEYVWTL